MMTPQYLGVSVLLEISLSESKEKNPVFTISDFVSKTINAKLLLWSFCLKSHYQNLKKSLFSQFHINLSVKEINKCKTFLLGKKKRKQPGPSCSKHCKLNEPIKRSTR